MKNLQNLQASWIGLSAYRYMIWELLHRDIVGRYKGSFLGVFWSFLTPMLMLAVYSFVFGVVFKARWGEASTSKYEYTLSMFAGLLIFNVFSECVSRAPSQILSNSNYVKKIVFPLEILPVIIVGSATFHFFVGFLLWICFHIAVVGLPSLHILLAPLLIFPFFAFNAGLAWILSSLGVFLRDINQVIGVFVSSLMFLSPIFYPASALPTNLQWLVYINPLTPAIEIFRNLLIQGAVPAAGLWICSSLFYLTVACLGFFWFQKTRRAFADVI